MKALLVKIRKRKSGENKYPDFDSLAVIINSGYSQSTPGRRNAWSRYAVVEGIGWQYDQKCKHNQVSVDSPRGVKLGVLIVPAAFADQAAVMFPTDCTILSDAEAETFYEEKVAVDLPSEEINESILTGIKLKTDLSIPLTAEQIDAKDPTKDTAGVRVNKMKTWSGMKERYGFTLQE